MGAALLGLLALLVGDFQGQLGASELIAVGLVSFATVCVAIWSRKTFDVLEPIVLIAISAFIGSALRSIYIAWSPK